MWRAIWNGPFYIGKLERPVSVGDAIMKILETLWRVGIIGLIGFAALLVALSYSSWSANQVRDQALADTDIVVRANFAGCPVGSPIEVTLGNRGTKALTFITYNVRIIDPVNGQDLAPMHFKVRSHSDRMEPDQGMRWCLSPDDELMTTPPFQLRSDMLLSGEVTYVSVL